MHHHAVHKIGVWSALIPGQTGDNLALPALRQLLHHKRHACNKDCTAIPQEGRLMLQTLPMVYVLGLGDSNSAEPRGHTNEHTHTHTHTHTKRDKQALQSVECTILVRPSMQS